MKKKIKIEIDAVVERVGMHFDHDGITAMVHFDENHGEDFLISWDELEEWAMASSQDAGDCETICSKLRKLANDLEKWNAAIAMARHLAQSCGEDDQWVRLPRIGDRCPITGLSRYSVGRMVDAGRVRKKHVNGVVYVSAKDLRQTLED